MTNTLLHYRGYYSHVYYSAEDQVLHGRLENIRDLVTFECDTASGVEAEFHAAVDDYLDTCAQLGKSPEKPHSGSFNVRLTPEAHRRLDDYAVAHDMSLNAVVSQAVGDFLARCPA